MSKIYTTSIAGKHSSLAGFFSKNILLLVIGLMGICGYSHAQVTVGATPYTTLGAAFTAINAGTHTGAITITISGNTTEASTAILNSSGTGAANYTSISIKPTATATISGNIAGALVKLSGADNVTIDGFIGAGPARSLTFTNTSTSTSSAIIWLGSASGSDGTTNNVIKNCVITGSGNLNTFIGIVSSSGTTLGGVAEAANSGNTYQNNAISASQYGIALVGPTGNEPNNVITGNSIGSVTAASKIGFKGVAIFQQQDVLVSQNTIFGVAGVTGSGTVQTSGIYVAGTINGGLIERNNISDVEIAGFWGCNGIQLQSTSATTNLTIANNFIYNIVAGGFTTADTVDDGDYGIAVVTGGGYKIYYNSIDLSNNQTGTPGISAAFWVSLNISSAQIDLRNNIFSNRQTTGTRYSIWTNVSAPFSTINYNDYFSTGSVGFLTSARATLGNWQSATGQDANSAAVNPVFTSTTDLHLQGSSPLDGLAVTGTGITIDYDNTARNGSTPDIGADEFTPPVCSSSSGGTASANPSSICVSGSTTLSSTGFSYGTGITYQWQYFNGASWVPLVGQTNPNSANTGIISTTTQYRLSVFCPASGTNTSNVVTVVAATPNVTSSAGATRCGIGTVNLTAAGTGPLYWYTTATGGIPIGTGSPFTTPSISATTTYYVGVTLGGTPEAGGKPSSTGADGSFLISGWGVVFDANQAFTLTSAVVYPIGTGTIDVGLYNSSGTEITSSGPISVSGTGVGTPATLPLGFAVPVGSGYRLLVKATSGITGLIRDFTTAFPYPSPSGALNVTSGWNGGVTTTNYFFYNLIISAGCESTPRVAVTATVTAPPGLNVPTATPATICVGQSSTLFDNDPDYNSFVWTPGPLSGTSVVVSPAATTTYTLTATSASNCVNTATVTVTVNATPTAVVVTPSAANVCGNPTPSVTTLTASGGALPGQTIFAETFESFPLASWTTFNNGSGSITVGQNSTYYQQGTSSVHFQNSVSGDNADGGIYTTNNINLSAFTNPVLTFYHICATEKTFDFGYVQYSTDGGTTWTSFPTSSYGGTGTLKNGVVSFDASSYPDWNGQFTGTGSDPGTAPATSLWKLETINLNTWQSSTQFRVRFRETTDVSLAYYGWLIDNVKISGTGQGSVIWTPNGVGSGLFTDAGATMTYFGTATNTVYAKITSSQVFTATVGSGSCTSSATATLTVTSVAVGVSISASPGASACVGQSVTFTATPTNGGTTPSYTWKVNGSTVASGIGMNTYTTSTLITGDQVSCQLLSNISGACVTNNPANSNIITMTMNPYPTVSINSGPSTVCNGSTTTLTSTAAPGGGSYQWMLNGGNIGGAIASSYGATLPGSYLLIYTSAAGCPDTSNAALVLTLPTYNITVTQGANGTISPAGPVAVDCGNNQVFTITPNPGYSICGVTVDGSGVGNVGTYTFTNVVANGHTITAAFCVVGCASPPTATANTGAINATCGSTPYTLSGSVGGSATPGSSTWSTSGDGTFNPNNVFTTATTYTPGPNDINNGTVTLTLTTNDPDAGGPCLASTSSMTLTVKPVPAVSITGLLGICPSSSTTLTASTTFPSGSITGYQWYQGATPLGTASTQVVSATGNYSVTVTGSNGCTNSDAVVIVNFTPPTISISGPTLICTNATITLTATATAGSGTIGATSYQWYKNGISQPGETAAAYIANSAGTYTVSVTNSNGCTTTSANFVVTQDNSPLVGVYTIGVGPVSCTNYASFSSAFSDLNKRGVGGVVRFDVPAGYVETAPVGGLMLGSNVNNILSSTLSATNTLTFNKSGAGANPKINAYVGTALPTAAIPDGIVHLKGVSYVTFDAIDLNDGNSTNPATMEYGYGFFKTNVAGTVRGAQNNTIQNCVITMNRANGTGGTLPMPDGSHAVLVINTIDSAATTPLTPTAASGANSNNKFYANTIQNCNGGIALSGFATASSALADNGNDIGGIIPSTGNNIINYGGIAGASNAANAVRLINQWGANVSNNIINNNNGSGVSHVNVLRGIVAETWGGSAGNLNFSNNTISIFGNSAGASDTAICNRPGVLAISPNTLTINSNTITGVNAAATTALFTAIYNNSDPSTGVINGNTIQNATHAGSGAWSGIVNVAAATTLSINNNIIQNQTLTTTGAFQPILNSGAVGTLNITGNSITNNTRTAVSATAINLVTIGAVTTSVVSNNTISNNTMASGGTAFNYICILGNLGNNSITGNTIYNNGISTISGAVNFVMRGYSNTSGNTSPETISNNIIRKLYITTATTNTGLHEIRAIHTATNSASNRTVNGNLVDTLYSSAGLSVAITGISSGSGGTVNIYKNKVMGLYPGQSATPGSFAKGMTISSGTTVTAYNNIFNIDLTGAAPAVNSVLTAADAVKGIEVSNGTTVNLYYNTIRLAGAGSGAAFTSSGIGLTSTAPTVTLKDNIIDNLMSNGGTAPGSVAFRRTTSALTGYSSTSNNNLFYAGAASATNLLYYDGTNSSQTLAAYQAIAGMSPRETNSVSFAPVFMSATDMRPDPSANCQADGQGTPISSPFAITDDYAAVTRDATLPDIGAYEFTGTGGTPTWRGLNTDWMNVNNWCGVLPTVATDVVIPSGVPNYPVITTNAPVAKSVTINGGSITINPGGSLSVKADFTVGAAGTLTNNGRIILNGTTSQNFPGAAAGTIAAMDTVEVNNNGGGLNLNKSISITGQLAPTLGTITLNANNITLKSTATKTAQVAAVGTSNAFVYNSTGRFVVERFIQTGSGGSLHGKTWQFLAVPTKGDFIKTSWMENNAPTGNTGPAGFGTIITSEKAGATGRGYDFVTAPGPSMKSYNPATNGWNSVDDGVTTTAAKVIDNQQGYMLFVRGDRSVQTAGGTANPTNMRTTGKLYAPGADAPPTTNVLANKFESIGNPYASAIDFTTLARTGGVDNAFYVWDPTLSGTNGFGGYQTISAAGGWIPSSAGTTDYPAATVVQKIQSGQAFFVHATGSAGTVPFAEANKATGSRVVTKPGPVADRAYFRAALYAGSGSTAIISDGNVVAFDYAFDDDVDGDDALKLMNAGENFAIARDGNILAVEARMPVASKDTIFYYLTNLRQQTYEFRFTPQSMNVGPNLHAFLVDKFENKRTQISLDGNSVVSFVVTNKPGSYAADRFMIVFKGARTHPHELFTNVDAVRQDKNILVNWNVSDEEDIIAYEVEKSVDGNNFSKLNEQNAKTSGTGPAQYSWIDNNPVEGDNFYRIHSVGAYGESLRSKTVKVNIAKMPPSITVFPNPVQDDRTLYVNMTNKNAGTYTLVMTDSKGQQVMSQIINHAGGNNVYTIAMDKLKTHGSYLLTIAGDDLVKSTFKIVY